MALKTRSDVLSGESVGRDGSWLGDARDASRPTIYSCAPMPKKPDTSPPKSFEAALAELEEILGQIESGQVGLEESLVKYERGNFLIRHCRGILNSAEQKIELLSKAENGELQSEPLEDEDDEPP